MSDGSDLTPQSLWHTIVLCSFNGCVACLFTIIGQSYVVDENWQVVFEEIGSAATLVTFMNELYDNSEMYNINDKYGEPVISKWCMAALGFILGAIALQSLKGTLSWFVTPFDDSDYSYMFGLDLIELFVNGLAISFAVASCAGNKSVRQVAFSCSSDDVLPNPRDIIITGILSIDDIAGGLSTRTLVENTTKSGVLTGLLFAASIVAGGILGWCFRVLIASFKKPPSRYCPPNQSRTDVFTYVEITIKSFVFTAILAYALDGIGNGLRLPVIIGFVLVWFVIQIKRKLRRGLYYLDQCCVDRNGVGRIPLFTECERQEILRHRTTADKSTQHQPEHSSNGNLDVLLPLCAYPVRGIPSLQLLQNT
jgi:hypothetical protein